MVGEDWDEWGRPRSWSWVGSVTVRGHELSPAIRANSRSAAVRASSRVSYPMTVSGQRHQVRELEVVEAEHRRVAAPAPQLLDRRRR